MRRRSDARLSARRLSALVVAVSGLGLTAVADPIAVVGVGEAALLAAQATDADDVGAGS
jgi:outer membrane protein OmpA-like peptidoglycan-associated protein